VRTTQRALGTVLGVMFASALLLQHPPVWAVATLVGLLAERLDQKRHCPGFHRPDAGRNIAMAGDEDDGNFHGDLSQSRPSNAVCGEKE
jgi:hypothetical protein